MSERYDAQNLLISGEQTSNGFERIPKKSKPMRVVLISQTGDFWTAWLPSLTAGHYRFLDDDGIEAPIPFYIEAHDGHWVFLTGKTATILSRDADNRLQNSGHELMLADKMLVRIRSNASDGLIYVLYSEEEHHGANVFLPYYLEERTDYTIGRKPECEIFYPNNTVSRTHATLHWDNGKWYIIDTFSTNGVYVNGKRIEPSVPYCLQNGDRIFIMGLMILVGVGFFSINNADNRVIFNTHKIRRIHNQSDAKFSHPSEEGHTASSELYDRPPRRMIKLDPEPIEIDLPPMTMNANKIPLMLRLGSPLVMGGRAIASGNYLMALTSLVFPALTQGLTEKDRKEYEARRTERYHEYLTSKEAEIESEQHLEESLLNQNYPPLSEVMLFPVKRQRLWERRIRDEDFLAIRIGVGQIPMIAEKNYSKQRFEMDPDPLAQEMYSLAEKTTTLNQAPVMLSLKKDWAIGVLGDTKSVSELFRNLILQIAATHSYDEVKLVVFVEKDCAKELDFVRYLPHAWDNERTVRFYAQIQPEVQPIGSYLSARFDEILQQDKPERLLKDRPHYVIFAMSKKLFDSVEVIKNILHQDHYSGMTVITAFDTPPKECSKIIDLQAQPQIIDLNRPEEETQTFSFDDVMVETAQTGIQALIQTKLKFNSQQFSLPNMITFLQMFQVGRVEQLNPLKRWTENNPAKSLAAPVGVAADGSLFTLDLHEKRQGPHGLIAGMTGSGKSEFIITYILSMAVNFSPEEVAFILIDYKGGGLANAFEDKKRGVQLPHLAGTITNLDGAAINRSLASINSELKRRQNVFARVNSMLGEGTINIYDYQKLYRAGKVAEPLPHLFIISDEFAELKAQQPAFMDELISAARIGRSLGVHLILATQKPGGVVNNQIWSNTKFRVCLKVQDKNDSEEMLKRPEAAELKQTGRFYLQVGYNEFFALGQSAWCGAKYVPQDEVFEELDNSIQFLDNPGQTLLSAKPKKEEPPSQGQQVVAIVKYLSDLAKQKGLRAMPLWKEQLPELLDYEALERRYTRPEGAGIYALIGEIDDPELQNQHAYWLNLLDFHNMMLCGGSGSGKSSYLRTLLFSLSTNYAPSDVNYYILDLSNGALSSFARTPHCGAYLTEKSGDDLPRLLDLIGEIIERRKKQFLTAEVDSFNAYRQLHPLPLILVIIDGYTNLPNVTNGDSLFIKMHEYLRDGANYGVRYLLAINHSNEISGRAKMEIDCHVALQAKDRFDYSEILEVKCKLFPPSLTGRGMCVEKDRALEFHTAILDSEQSEQARSHSLKKRLTEINEKYHDCRRAESLPMLNSDETFMEFCNRFESDRLPLGYVTSSLKPVAVPFRQLHSISLYFGNPKGVVPCLVNLLQGALSQEMDIYFVKRDNESVVDDFESKKFVTPVLSRCARVLSCSPEDLSALSALLVDEIKRRNVFRDAYCEQQGIPESTPGRSKLAEKYIRANSRPLLVLFESFSDLCAAELDEAQTGIYSVFFDQMFGYNIYFAACFYPEDDSSFSGSDLIKCYNRAGLLLLFGGCFNQYSGSKLPFQMSKMDRKEPDLSQFIMQYQSEYYSMTMPGLQLFASEEDPDDLPIV